MTRIEIRNAMLKRIQEHLDAEIEDLVIEDLIDEDTVMDFLWEKDFGYEHVRNYIEEHKDELVENYLEDIYSEIDDTDLESPF